MDSLLTFCDPIVEMEDRMPGTSGRTTEAEFSRAVLEILANEPNGEATIEHLKSMIPKHIQLTAADKAQSTTRPNEELWEQQIRNITSHRKADGNIIADGFAAYIEGGLQITSAGRIKIG